MKCLLVALLIAALSTIALANDFAVIGYLPEYRKDSFDFDAAFRGGVTHVIFFSLEVGADGMPSALDRMPTKEQSHRARVAADNVGGKTMLCYGGFGRSDGFAKMVLSDKLRKAFLEATDALLKEHEMDGVDWNWEYPKNEAEWRGWAKLVKESKATLLGGKAVITAAYYPDPQQTSMIKVLEVFRACDYVLSMSYDAHGEHSTFEFMQETIRKWRGAALPMGKLAVGVPFYARHTRTGDAMTFPEILDIWATTPQGKAKALPTDLDVVKSYYFNSQRMLERKVKSAVAQTVGGVMIWELGQDVQPLTRADGLMEGIRQGLPISEDRAEL